MAIGDKYRLSIVGDWGAANVAVNTIHFRMKSLGATPQDACLKLHDYFDTYVKIHQSNTFTWRYINWLSVGIVPPVSGTYTTGFPIAGSLAEDSVGQQLAAICTLRTQYAGRSYRGRIYLPALGETKGDGTGPIAAVQTSLNSMLSSMATTLGVGGSDPDLELVIWSKKLNTAYPISSGVARTAWGVIRRRRAGVGI